jgi:hypothetical protein
MPHTARLENVSGAARRSGTDRHVRRPPLNGTAARPSPAAP